MEHLGSSIKGTYRDIMLNADHRVIHDSGWVSNTIVDQGRSLLAALMKGETVASGIKYMAVGSGEPFWDTFHLLSLQNTTGLVTPYAYHIDFMPEDIVYLDNQDNVVSTVGLPTSRLEIKAVLGPNLPVPGTSELREFGLFGKFGNQDLMINSVRHPLLQKAATDTLERVVHLYF